MRARVKNELQHLCLNKGVLRKHKLWSQAGQQILRELPLKPWAGRRRDDLLKLMAMLDQQIEPLDQAVKAEAQRDKMALLLQTQPGVGPITALAYVLTLGDVSRFPRGKQVASYLGLIPREHSSGGQQKLGAITKQGNRMLRMLLVEAAQIAVRYDPQFRREYLHRCHQKPKAVAKVAADRARFLAPSLLHSRPNICLLPKSGTEFDDCDECHKDPCGTSDTTTWLRARLRRTLLVWVLGTPCEALDGCLQPEGFDSPVLHTTVQPNWNLKTESIPQVS